MILRKGNTYRNPSHPDRTLVITHIFNEDEGLAWWTTSEAETKAVIAAKRGWKFKRGSQNWHAFNNALYLTNILKRYPQRR